MVDDVDKAVDFYTSKFGFEPGHNRSPAFAEVSRGNLRLLLAGPESSAGRPMPDGRKPEPGGWNRILKGSKTMLRDERRILGFVLCGFVQLPAFAGRSASASAAVRNR
jgi:hypothetical protein